jgi:hypothetical protein
MAVVDFDPMVRVCMDNRLDPPDNGRERLRDGVVEVCPEYGNRRYEQAGNTPAINDDDVRDILRTLREFGADEPSADADGCERRRRESREAND